MRSSGREVKVYGINACLALFKHRPSSIIRVYTTQEGVRVFSELLKWCAEHRKAYHITPEEDFPKITGSQHHEGICILAKELLPPSFTALGESLDKESAPATLICLEGVGNPHNIGAILRAGAQFGVRALLSSDAPPLSGAMCRVAEGAAEITPLISIEDTASALKKLKQIGFKVIATSSKSPQTLYDKALPARAVFIFGSEAKGISKKTLREADATLSIPGTGMIESLNVASATAVVLAEHWRQHRVGEDHSK